MATRDRRPAGRIINLKLLQTLALLLWCSREQRLCTNQQSKWISCWALSVVQAAASLAESSGLAATSLQVSAKTPITAALAFPEHKYNNGEHRIEIEVVGLEIKNRVTKIK